ncbi:hypothetical protein [Tenacibaculum finnmarkense]|uniref:hypothetical protein n=1 Tax=Tenacibaculum finnmarkense TaxID=2781243 RepID=UPI000C67415F|nr:hypothetical protein [Tenacibaculum finnmarkense]MCG8776458.1 hypothetical protein [Tenacibaculum finnmarkense]SOS49717.1 conserved hypothetical protein [Tenacibaculum finnmarkense]
MKKTTTKKISKNLKSTNDFVSENKKQLLYVGGSILLLYTIYKVSSSFFSGAKNGISNALDDKIENVVSQVKINPKETTISLDNAKIYAQQLLNACNNGPFYGTDEELIRKVFKKIKTGDDFKLVFNAFGEKNYNGYNSPPTGISRHLDNYAPRNLVYWLRAELSARDGAVYNEVKERIESVGIAF